eukprot:COSAG01_NODE_7015_length_3392_cov_1.507136_1_plen_130_part_00
MLVRSMASTALPAGAAPTLAASEPPAPCDEHAARSSGAARTKLGGVGCGRHGAGRCCTPSRRRAADADDDDEGVASGRLREADRSAPAFALGLTSASARPAAAALKPEGCSTCWTPLGMLKTWPTPAGG